MSGFEQSPNYGEPEPPLKGGATPRAAPVLILIALAVFLSACEGDYYGVPYYCDEYYEAAQIEGYWYGREEGMKEGQQETCGAIKRYNYKVYDLLRSRGVC